ncbi:MAG: 3-oxoacid CoA-transferase subunit A [Chloroflexi bacterium]|nr:3-oxoacid CoA-transferase subunit A [Chloroflexota bacterium]
MSTNKVCATFREAVADLFDGAVLMIGGFGGVGGMPHYLLLALREQGARDLTIISNTMGIASAMGFGTPKGVRPVDVSILVENGQVRKAITTFPTSPSPSRPTAFELAYRRGQVELETVPQGTLTERMRAAGAGIAAFYTPTGVGTVVEQGKEKRVFDGREYILECALKSDFALIRARQADTLGNLVYRGTSRNFAPIMAMAARVTIAEVDYIVQPGELDPEAVVTTGIFVKRIVKRPSHTGGYQGMGAL